MGPDFSLALNEDLAEELDAEASSIAVVDGRIAAACLVYRDSTPPVVTAETVAHTTPDGELLVEGCVRRSLEVLADRGTDVASSTGTSATRTSFPSGRGFRPTAGGFTSSRCLPTGRGRVIAMADSSFDIVSKIDRQEADNALNQARKEVEQRYDFKGTDASIDWSGEAILIKANSEERAKAILDVFQSKLIKRGISLKSLESGDPQASGKEYRITSTLKEGISSEEAKKISKLIRDEGPKSVKAQIQGDELRVQSKSRDDLQEVQRMLKAADLDIDVQFVNYR